MIAPDRPRRWWVNWGIRGRLEMISFEFQPSVMWHADGVQMFWRSGALLAEADMMLKDDIKKEKGRSRYVSAIFLCLLLRLVSEMTAIKDGVEESDNQVNAPGDSRFRILGQHIRVALKALLG